MNTEEPAWKAELREALEERFPLIRNAVTRDAIRVFVAEQIQAAEQRGREAALREAAAELRESIGTTDYPHETDWVSRYVAGWRHAADLIDPDKPCERCKGSGIDPEHSRPAEGPSYYSMGEPEVLEPCVACQYPDKP